VKPPWLDLPQLDNETAEEVRKQIMSLPKSKRNFLEHPPPEANFQFNYDDYLPVALVALQEDTNLSDIRFRLVPQYIREPKFWRNYFYRVSMIKAAYGLKETKPQSEKVQVSKSQTEVKSAAGPQNTVPSLETTAPVLAHSESVVEVNTNDKDKDNDVDGDEESILVDSATEEFISDSNDFLQPTQKTSSKLTSNTAGSTSIDLDDTQGSNWEEELKAELEDLQEVTDADLQSLDLTSVGDIETTEDLASLDVIIQEDYLPPKK